MRYFPQKSSEGPKKLKPEEKTLNSQNGVKRCRQKLHKQAFIIKDKYKLFVFRNFTFDPFELKTFFCWHCKIFM